MTADITTLDAHEQPSDELRGMWKTISKTEQGDLLKSGEIDDLSSPDTLAELRVAGTIPASTLNSTFKPFLGSEPASEVKQDAPIYFHPLLPGLLIIPSLLPPEIQEILVDRLAHRDLSNPQHQTNMHLHWKLPYPEPTGSFFSHAPDSSAKFEPKDPNVHKPLSMKVVMEKRLHWVTLGGQYDWTNRVYPGELPPAFPPDIANLLESLFPETVAQAAIVNFYSAGDSMMMHRDVSEETDKGLISISLGCDGLFMIAPNDVGKMTEEEKSKLGKKHLLLRLRSGDAIYMTKESRFAWHGVPKILKGTCPPNLAEWPAKDGKYEEWRGWLANKRINLNVRQMKD